MAPADIPTLHVCHLDDAGGPLHPCSRAARALRSAGIEHRRNIFDRNRPFGLFTSGKRPALKELSGQEQLPVLELPDGTTIAGSGKIVAWAKAQEKAA